MRFGVPLGLVRPDAWRDLATAADELGFDSVWLPDHLVFGTDLPAALADYPYGNPPALRADTPLPDAAISLAVLAGATTRVRLGTAVYLFGLRHPLVTARAFATLDRASGGRTVLGVGAGWYRGEWDALGVDFAGRGRRLDEALAVARRLWSEPTVAHEGEFTSFPEVALEPKPPRHAIPVLAGGESPAALRRAARNDGWISMPTTRDDIAPRISALRRLRQRAGRAEAPFEIVAHAYGLTGPEEVPAWARLGVDTLLVRPWHRGRDAVASLGAFAERHGLTPRKRPAS